MLLMFLFSAIALGASVVVRVEIAVAERFRQAAEALYAADAGLAIAMAELRALPSWTPVLDGSQRSALSVGGVAGERMVPGGGAVLICCGPASASDRLARDTALSPVPARRALQWQPFLWSPFDALVPALPPTGLFIIVWVADDEGDGDGDAAADANGVVIVRSEAIGASGLRRIVEAHAGRRTPPDVVDEEAAPEGGEEGPPEAPVAPENPPAVRLLGWREVR